MISWASFPELIWWNREASWQQASWHPQQHFMIFGTHEKQAKLPPQMAISLLLIRSSVCDSEINIFIGSSKFQLSLLWTCILPASVGHHFFHFYMGLANGSWCWKSSHPQATRIAIPKVELLSLLSSGNPALLTISTKAKEINFAMAKWLRFQLEEQIVF